MSILGIGFIAFAFILIIVFSIRYRKLPAQTLREIAAFQELNKTIDLSVEDGTRLQISLGSRGILGSQSASVFAGLTLLREIARIAADSDQPPIATSGEGLQNILAHDVLRNTYKELGLTDEYHHRLARVTGLSPFSYGAGTMHLILDNFSSSSALLGSFSAEAGLITAATQRRSAFTLGATEGLLGQSILFASTDQPLIGEELFAIGAYLDSGPAHSASLRTQDLLRWLLILSIIALALARLVGAFI
jgi:hypothetical protein